LWNGHKLDASNLKIFDCIAYALIQNEHREKQDSHSIEYIFLSYDDQFKAYRLMKKGTKQTIMINDVIFYEMLNK
jgi:hypothetical protein